MKIIVAKVLYVLCVSSFATALYLMAGGFKG